MNVCCCSRVLFIFWLHFGRRGGRPCSSALLGKVLPLPRGECLRSPLPRVGRRMSAAFCPSDRCSCATEASYITGESGSAGNWRTRMAPWRSFVFFGNVGKQGHVMRVPVSGSVAVVRRLLRDPCPKSTNLQLRPRRPPVRGSSGMACDWSAETEYLRFMSTWPSDEELLEWGATNPSSELDF